MASPKCFFPSCAQILLFLLNLLILTLKCLILCNFSVFSIFVILGTVYKLENGKRRLRNDRCSYFFVVVKITTCPKCLLKEVARSFDLGLFVCFWKTNIHKINVCLFLKLFQRSLTKKNKNLYNFSIYMFCVKVFGCQIKEQLILEHTNFCLFFNLLKFKSGA
jgi:hypothetical protein